MLYHAYQAQTDLMWPLRTSTKAGLAELKRKALHTPPDHPARKLAAACEVFALTEVTHRRPAFGIAKVSVAGQPVAVVEEVVQRTPFATLLRFAKPALPGLNLAPQPRVLIAAPMSGHFATLLRETVRTMLPEHDVYITDWHNAREVPLAAGRFGLDEYTEHPMQFVAALGEGAHLVAICQPCVAALAAVALMAEDAHPSLPASLTLMAGRSTAASARPRSTSSPRASRSRGSSTTSSAACPGATGAAAGASTRASCSSAPS